MDGRLGIQVVYGDEVWGVVDDEGRVGGGVGNVGAETVASREMRRGEAFGGFLGGLWGSF